MRISFPISAIAGTLNNLYYREERISLVSRLTAGGCEIGGQKIGFWAQVDKCIGLQAGTRRTLRESRC